MRAENPTKWESSILKLNDSTYIIRMEVSISSHWHVYSHYIKDGGPVPTSILYDELVNANVNDSIIEIGEIIEVFDPNFDMKLKWYDHKASFMQAIHLNGEGKIKGSLEFMACDEKQCLPPDYINFEFSIPKDAKPIDEVLKKQYLESKNILETSLSKKKKKRKRN